MKVYFIKWTFLFFIKTGGLLEFSIKIWYTC